jgi:rod shape-determining protein MreC
MSYRETRKEVLVFLLLVVLHLLLISIQIPGAGRKSLLESGIFGVVAPIERAAAGVVGRMTGTWKGYINLRSARAENEQLKKEKFFLTQDKAFLEEKLRYYAAEEILKKSLELFDKDLKTARIIGSDTLNMYQTVVIDKGTMDGVVKNMAVCDKFGDLVGRVIEPIGLREAMVQLITDKDSGVSVISGENKLIGLVSGRSQYLIEMKYVLASSPPGKEGEELFTTGFDGIFIPGIRVGRILTVTAESDNPIFQRIIVQPDFRFSELEVVGLIPPISGSGVK